MYDTKLSPEQVNHYADQYEAAGDIGYGKPAYVWWHGVRATLPNGAADWDAPATGERARLIADGTITYQDGCNIEHEVYRRKIQRAIEAFETTPAIKAHMLAAIKRNERNVRAPEKADMSFFCKAAKSEHDQYGKPRKPFTPRHECNLRLKLSEAVRFTHSQEAYADYSQTLIPVLGDVASASLEHCQVNLSELVRYADTHTGWAGSGCNYSAALLTNEHGAFVAITCRASISD